VAASWNETLMLPAIVRRLARVPFKFHGVIFIPLSCKKYTVGALNLASGQTGGARPENLRSGIGAEPPIVLNGTIIGNPPAAFEVREGRLSPGTSESPEGVVTITRGFLRPVESSDNGEAVSAKQERS
jgi:hypothetical protein